MDWKLFIVALMVMAHGVFGAEVPIKTIAKGAFSGIQEEKQLVITNQTQWAELWEKHTVQSFPKKPAPEVDFAKETVLFVSLGQKRTGGYSIEITDVRNVDGKTEVFVTKKEPKADGFNIQALTAPFQIVSVPRIEQEVKFKMVQNKAGG